MNESVNYLELFKQSQHGHKQSMDQLTELVEDRLFSYFYRLTLNYELSRDLLQETLLQMIKSLKDLEFEHVEQFWAWLYRTALGKVQLHFRAQRKRKEVQMSVLNKDELMQRVSHDDNDGLSSMVRRELSEAIFNAMAKLKLRHRNILVLRCFEQKSYSEIAGIMDCSVMAAQVLLYRARHSLGCLLSRQGVDKGMLLVALGLFARMTATAEAATVAAVTAASIKVALVPALIGAATTELGIAIGTAVAVAAVTVGSMTTINQAPSESSYQHPAESIPTALTSEQDEFKYPSEVVGAYDPDGNGWQGIELDGRVHNQIDLEQWLVGPSSSKLDSVNMPLNHWIELKFEGQIVDGGGDDIVLVEFGPSGEQARVFITDGAGNQHLLGTATTGTLENQGPAEIGFDISGLSLSFKPCAVKIQVIKGGGTTAGFDLSNVRARIQKTSQ